MVDAFVADRSDNYLEHFVDILLASEHWGEHRGRYWLDAARYADTHGLHFDNYREMWPYRNWVIDAFNHNQPYDQFVVDQIAGDLLDNPTDSQHVATGFQRCNITTNEGGTIEKENLALYANDRVTTTGWVFLGLTTNCGACHDHKFDPFTQKDFYAMAAFYRNTEQSGYDKNWREGDGAIIVPQTDHDQNRWQRIPGELQEAAVIESLRSLYVGNTYDQWIDQLADESFIKSRNKEPLFGDEFLRARLTDDENRNPRVQLDGHSFDVPASSEIAWTNEGVLGSAPILDKDRFLNLDNSTDLDQNEPFSFSAWVYLPKDYDGSGSIIAQMAGNDQNNRGWDLFIADKRFGIHLIHSWPKVAMKAESERQLETERWHLLTATYDGSSRSAGVELFVNGQSVKKRGGQNRLENSIRNNLSVRIGRRQDGSELDGVGIQDIRIYRRQLDQAEVKVLAVAPRLDQALINAAISDQKPDKSGNWVNTRAHRSVPTMSWLNSSPLNWPPWKEFL
jgi:hypothetical protein